jgi:hypothetical protein
MKHNDYLETLRFIANVAETRNKAKLNKSAFTRNRKMPFAKALSFLLDMRKTTLQTRLNLFCEHTGGGKPISQQAFSKLRMNFDHTPFESMVRTTVQKEYSGQYELPLFHGYHVFAVDGSYLQLPRIDELRKEYGVRGLGSQPSAGISVLYDVLHGWAIDPIITHTDMNERTECEKHICFLCEKLPHIAQNSIVTLDRGYPSSDLFAKMHESGLKFVARCNWAFTSEIKNAPLGDSIITMKNGLSVRIIKFALENGEVETLATNLFDLAEEIFPELYALRWVIETAYFRLKQELCAEKFSGKTPNSIRQDFWANMVLFNAVAVFQREADEAVQKRQQGKSIKHVNRARTSDLIITLRDRFIFAVLCGNPTFAATEMDSIIKTMARAVSPVRQGRKFNRTFRPVNSANHNLKSHL